MTETVSNATTVVVSGAAVVTGATFLGADTATWIGAVAGVAFFMMQSSERTIAQRLMLFVPSSIGTAFGASAAMTWWGVSDKYGPFFAFAIGLIIVVVSGSWIKQAQAGSWLLSILEKFGFKRGDNGNP